MQKAMLVMNEPQSCGDCTFCGPYEECTAMMRRTIYVDLEHKKPDWCPLVLMPEKKETEVKTGVCGEYKEGYEDGFDCGYNDCIDEILRRDAEHGRD